MKDHQEKTDDQVCQAHLVYQADKDHRESPVKMQLSIRTHFMIWRSLDLKDHQVHKAHLVSLETLDYQV